MYDTTYTATGRRIRQRPIQTAGRPSHDPRRSQDGGGSAGGSAIRAGSSGASGGAIGPNPMRPASAKQPATTAATANRPMAASIASVVGVAVSGPSLSVLVWLASGIATSPMSVPSGRRRTDREPDLVHGPGDRMEDRDDRGQQGERDHDEHEQVVRSAQDRRRAAGGDGHDEGLVAEVDGRRHQGEDRQHPPERRADEDEQAHRRDRVRGDPLARQGQPEEQADRRHEHHERAAEPPAAGPQAGEQDVRGEDEQPDVDVVHRDPRLDEEHPVGEGEDRHEHADLAAPEQQPGQQEQEPGGQRAGDDARAPAS